MSNERKIHDVVSLEPDKVTVRHVDSGEIAVVKQSKSIEVQNMQDMRTHITRESNSTMLWNGQPYQIVIPEIISWDPDSNLLIMNYFEGDNLELSLRNPTKGMRERYVDFSHNFIKWMQQSGILWGDAAPRNIIINERRSEIGIVDFEKGHILNDRPYTHSTFNSVARGIIYEEFCAFLFPEEQDVVFRNIWEDNREVVPDSYLMGKRERLLYELLFGRINETIPLSKAIYVQKTMANTVTPYIQDGEPFFPLTHLGKAKSAQEYVYKILELREIEKSSWKTYLQSSNLLIDTS